MSAMTKKQTEQNNKRILKLLDELGGKFLQDDDVIAEGEKMVLPTNMSMKQAIKFLEQRIAEDEAMVAFSKVFNYRPWDGAFCTYNVFKATFGGVLHKGIPGWWGPEPPELRTIPSGVNSTVQVPWGVFSLPIFPNSSFTMNGHNDTDKGVLFKINVNARKKDRHRIEGLFKLIEEELKENSLYRGKAFDGQAMPEFIDVWSVDRSKVVYSEDVMAQLGANVWSQLRSTEEFEKLGIPLKRAVLIHGAFGTGKTLACMLTGQEAEIGGWTFIRCRPGKDDLQAVLQTAKLYQPAVVFAEDVDMLADGEVTDRQTIVTMLDAFDGIDAKGTKILTVLTTNYPERIHAGMARPGRLDAMIEIGDLDEPGVRKLVETRIFEQLEAEIDWLAVFEAAEGYKPAFVTEFADRTLRYVLNRYGSVEGNLIGTAELIEAANGLRPQYELMMGAKDKQVLDGIEVALGRTVKATVGETLRETIDSDYLT